MIKGSVDIEQTISDTYMFKSKSGSGAIIRLAIVILGNQKMFFDVKIELALRNYSRMQYNFLDF